MKKASRALSYIIMYCICGIAFAAPSDYISREYWQFSDKIGISLGPCGIAASPNGSIYLVDRSFNDPEEADSQNKQVRAFTPDGKLISSFGNFLSPTGLAIDQEGNIYFTDDRLAKIYKYSPTHEILQNWGTRGNDKGELLAPVAIALDSANNIFVVDRALNKVVKFAPDNRFLLEFGSYGPPHGLDAPLGIVINNLDQVFVLNGRGGWIEKFDNNGLWQGDGWRLPEEAIPISIALKDNGWIFVGVLSQPHSRVYVYDRFGKTVGDFPCIAPWPDEPNTLHEYMPWGMTIDKNQRLFVAELNFRSVAVFQEKTN